MREIYLDYNASTPVAEETLEAMRPFLGGHFGNPSSRHWAGAPARLALERARAQTALLLGCSPDEIVFTSGGTESNNFAIKGAFFAHWGKKDHIITTRIEHPAVLEPCRFVTSLGASVTLVGVDSTGTVDPDDVRKAITPRTLLVSVMHANNEVGTLQPIAEIGRIAREHEVWFHTDAAQSAGKVETRVAELGVDLLSLAGHKIYAPKGVGALFVRRGVTLTPLHHGAGHEGGRRAGTENVVLDVGLGAACEVATRWIDEPETRRLRDYFRARITERWGDRVVLNGHPDRRLPNTLSVSFRGKVGGDILAKLDGVAASTGAACHDGSVKLSHVLEAMGVPPETGMGTIRFSLGRGTSADEIDAVIELLEKALA